MSIFSVLFSSKNVIDKLADGVDKAFYTPQEKGADFITMLGAYEPFKIAQRFLALIITIPYVVVWLMVVVLYVFGLVMNVEHLMEGSKTLGTMNNEQLGMYVAIINGFYFGGGALEGMIKGARGN